MKNPVIDRQSNGDDAVAVEVAAPRFSTYGAHHVRVSDVERALADDRRPVLELVLSRFGTGYLDLRDF